jgi:hypothetical protein
MRASLSLQAVLILGLFVAACHHHKVTMPREEPTTPSPGADVVIPACAPRTALKAQDALEYGRRLRAAASTRGVKPIAEQPADDTGELAVFATKNRLRPGDDLVLHIHAQKLVTLALELLRIDASEAGSTLMLSREVQAGPQPAPTVSKYGSFAYTSYASWQPTITLPIPADYRSGIYLVRLTNPAGHSKICPIAIETPRAPARVVVLLPWLTRLSAYSHGLRDREDSTSLYTGWDGRRYTERLGSRVVAVQRPVENYYVELLLDTLTPLVRFLEGSGVPVTYITELSVEEDPCALSGYDVMVFGGHGPEYTSDTLRAAVIENIAAGVHLLSLASDAFAWRTEVHHDNLGNTLIEVDKSGPDFVEPVNGGESGKWLFRNLTDERGQRLGEEVITFARYFAYVGPKTPYPMTVSPRRAVNGREDPTLMQHWLFAGTNLALGEEIPDVLAGDLDAINPSSNLPAHKDLVILHSEVHWREDPPVVPNDMVLLERPNGQLTFHTGTWYMAKVMMSNAPRAYKLRRLVGNVLGRMLGTPYDLPHQN